MYGTNLANSFTEDVIKQTQEEVNFKRKKMPAYVSSKEMNKVKQAVLQGGGMTDYHKCPRKGNLGQIHCPKQFQSRATDYSLCGIKSIHLQSSQVYSSKSSKPPSKQSRVTINDIMTPKVLKNKGRFFDFISTAQNKKHRYRRQNQKQSPFQKLTSQKTQQSVESPIEDEERSALLEQYSSKKDYSPNNETKRKKKDEILLALKEHSQRGDNFKLTFGGEGELLFFHQKQPLNTAFGIKCSTPSHISAQQVIKSVNLTRSSSTTIPKPVRIICDYSQTKLKGSKRLNKSNISLSVSLSTHSHSQISIQNPSPLIIRQDRWFSNNGKRQTTSVPFFKATKGTSFTEVNPQINNNHKRVIFKGENQQKYRRRDHVSSFTSHTMNEEYRLKLKLKTIPQKDGQNITDKQIIEVTKQISTPKGTKTKWSDKITTVNSSLIFQLFDRECPSQF